MNEELAPDLRADITFAAATGEPLHAPMVLARFDRVETRLVLDTGSDTHLVTRELADALGLPLRPGEEGIDHAGNRVPSWTTDAGAVAIGGSRIALGEVVCIPAPPPFPGWGIGGALSPQRLTARGWAVVDLANDELLLLSAGEASVRAVLEDRLPGGALVALERVPDGTVVVPAAIEPFAEQRVLLNTGGRDTEFARATVPGLAVGAAGRLGGGVSGADVRGGRAGPQRLRIGGHSVVVADLAVRDRMEGVQGMVGMDLLRGSVLAVQAGDEGRVLWRLPSARPD